VEADGAADVVELLGEKRRRHRVVEPGAGAEDDTDQQEGGRARREREQEARNGRQPDRREDDPPLAEPVAEHAAGELRERVGGPHPRQREADGAVGDAQVVRDDRDDRADRQPGHHRGHEREGTQRQRRVGVPPVHAPACPGRRMWVTVPAVPAKRSQYRGPTRPSSGAQRAPVADLGVVDVEHADGFRVGHG